MRKLKKLFEGLRPNDLENLVLPTISVDEYESKVSEEGIVVAFLSEDKEPAEDLKHFIAHSSIEQLDAEVSPGPDPDGYYYVFVEFMRNREFIDKLLALLEDVYRVTNIRRWKMKVYGKKLSYRVTRENLEEFLILDKPKNIREKTAETILEWLRDSHADKISLRGNDLSINEHTKKILAFGNSEELYDAFDFHHKPLRLDETAIRTTRIFETALGGGWAFNQYENILVCEKVESDKILILDLSS
jgi:hypothetical protein